MSEWISVGDRLPVLLPNTWRTALPVNVIIEGFGQYLCYPCQYGNGVFIGLMPHTMEMVKVIILYDVTETLRF